MSYIYADNETHQWVRTVEAHTAPTAAGQLVTLTADGWDKVIDSNLAADAVIKFVKSIDDVSITNSGALVRGTSVSDYGPKISIYWNDFVGVTDNTVTGLAAGDLLSVNSDGKLYKPASGAGELVVVAVAEATGIANDEADDTGNGVRVIQVKPYTHTF